jgi:excisionase family DNA binding protein
MPTTHRPKHTDHESSQLRDLLSVPEAAERLRTPERFIRRLIAERRIRFYKVGRYIRFDSRDLDAFVLAGLIEPRRGDHH